MLAPPADPAGANQTPLILRPAMINVKMNEIAHPVNPTKTCAEKFAESPLLAVPERSHDIGSGTGRPASWHHRQAEISRRAEAPRSGRYRHRRNGRGWGWSTNDSRLTAATTAAQQHTHQHKHRDDS